MGRLIIFLIWIAILLLLVYIYFFHPALFFHLFNDRGAGSPYVNTPEGPNG